jgi:hypothetical protein
MTWFFGDKPFAEPTEHMVGFVYEIRDIPNDKLYIGKKLFWTTTKLAPLKGKTRRRHRRLQSNWRDYYSSSRALKAEVEIYGPEAFERNILVLCYSKTDMSWWETKIQMDRDVLRDPRYYNEIIACKISRRGLKTT